ncbi:MAG TPA: Gfo/Idh/MocA family oxidoreductase, partial [Rhodopila sp.]|nr:Gfo/Idh/MocA family oxidoreductase [Rhodopila sp.]
MRVVLIGVSHWHTPFFLDPCLELPEVRIVGVSDPDPARAEPVAAKAGCRAYGDYRELCVTERPDFAFALARHCDMAELARFLIDSRVPFAMAKPCAINAAEAADIAARARAAG